MIYDFNLIAHNQKIRYRPWHYSNQSTTLQNTNNVLYNA
ncbi:hypothetical protein ECSTECEH250_2543 [Escherichia coli STEC_EH250]|nr:hypothetical protein ECSTECEH250_2543 [Escherichia coli STEC_EH250]